MSEPYTLKPRKSAAEMLAERNSCTHQRGDLRPSLYLPLVDAMLDEVDRRMLDGQGAIKMRYSSFVNRVMFRVRRDPNLKFKVYPWRKVLLPWMIDLLRERGFEARREGLDLIVEFPAEVPPAGNSVSGKDVWMLPGG